MKRTFLVIAIVVIVSVSLVGGVLYWRGHNTISSNDTIITQAELVHLINDCQVNKMWKREGRNGRFYLRNNTEVVVKNPDSKVIGQAITESSSRCNNPLE